MAAIDSLGRGPHRQARQTATGKMFALTVHRRNAPGMARIGCQPTLSMVVNLGAKPSHGPMQLRLSFFGASYSQRQCSAAHQHSGTKNYAIKHDLEGILFC